LVRRLVELGFVPGQRVRIVAEGIGSREPLAVRVGQTTFALRQREAAFIMVTPA
jgi:ferrous iron transport protein A